MPQNVPSNGVRRSIGSRRARDSVLNTGACEDTRIAVNSAGLQDADDDIRLRTKSQDFQGLAVGRQTQKTRDV